MIFIKMKGALWRVIFFLGCFGFLAVSDAANYYVDNNAPCSGTGCDGTAWSKAWKTLDAIRAFAGDTVYISGGATSKTYSRLAYWQPEGGTSGNPIIYKAGQDAGHSGVVIFDGGGSAPYFVYGGSHFVLDGEYNGQQHIIIENFTDACFVNNSSTGVKLRYLTIHGEISMTDSSYYEVSNCYITDVWDHAITLGGNNVPEISWDTNKIHDNTFMLIRNTNADGCGADGIQWGKSLSVYHNNFKSYTDPSYPSLSQGAQHQDGIQTDGRYVKIYNNTFENMGNYAIFLELFSSSSDQYVYNNVIFMSNSNYQGYEQGISIGRSGGASGSITVSNVIVANNTVANYADSAVKMSANSQTLWDSSCKFYNNLSYNCGGGFDIAPGVTGYDHISNKEINDNSCGSHFIACRTLSGSGYGYDFHLLLEDTLFKDAGINTVSYVFSMDKDGISRPQGSAWDIGAYEYVESGGPTPPAPPTGLSVR